MLRSETDVSDPSSVRSSGQAAPRLKRINDAGNIKSKLHRMKFEIRIPKSEGYRVILAFLHFIPNFPGPKLELKALSDFDIRISDFLSTFSIRRSLFDILPNPHPRTVRPVHFVTRFYVESCVKFIDIHEGTVDAILSR